MIPKIDIFIFSFVFLLISASRDHCFLSILSVIFSHCALFSSPPPALFLTLLSSFHFSLPFISPIYIFLYISPNLPPASVHLSVVCLSLADPPSFHLSLFYRFRSPSLPFSLSLSVSISLPSTIGRY